MPRTEIADWRNFLVLRGWGSKTWDLCWLECNEPGLRRELEGKVICLCLHHAIFLERGFFNGSYIGAPLPPDSMSTHWPWREAAGVD